MKLAQITILLGIFFLMSCVSKREIVKTGLTPIENFTTQKLAGTYYNKPSKLDQSGGEPLEKFLFSQFKKYKAQEFIDISGIVKIVVLSEKEIEVQIIKIDTTIQRKFKGKLRGNYFELKRKIRPLGIPFIYFVYRESKVLISIDNEGNLLIKQGSTDFAWVFLMSAGSDNFRNYKYSKYE